MAKLFTVEPLIFIKKHVFNKSMSYSPAIGASEKPFGFGPD